MSIAMSMAVSMARSVSGSVSCFGLGADAPAGPQTP
jgi:hypothetical protein